MRKYIISMFFVLVVTLLCACGDASADDANKEHITVPSVVGLRIDEAESLLAQVGAKNVVTNADDYTDTEREMIFVTSQSIDADKSIAADKKIELKCNKICYLYLDLVSDDNLLFNKYSMDIYLDDELIGTIANGERIAQLKTTYDGKHELKAVKSGDDSVYAMKTLTIKYDSTVSGTVNHGGSIEFDDFVITEGVNGTSIGMPNVVGMVLSEAKTILTNTGFLEVNWEPYGDIWNEDNWIVIEQNVLPGEVVDKYKEISLNCQKLDNYFEELFKNKDANQIIEISKEKNITFKLFDNGYNDITDNIIALSQEEQRNWVCVQSIHDTSSANAAQVFLKKTLEEVPDEKNTTIDEDAVRYSTNSVEDSKLGNKGKYAYISKGKNYDNYIIIDFDEGYIYFFAERDNNTWCDKTKIDSGDLNSQLFTTYHDGGDTWRYCLSFKYKNQPYHLILEDNDHFTYDYSTTDLEQAIKYRNSKNITEY